MDNNLYHALGFSKKKHKYVAKITKNKKTRYFYSKEEWLAYLKGKDSNHEDTGKKQNSFLSTKFKAFVTDGKKVLNGFKKKTSKNVDKVVKKTSDTVDKTFKKASTAVDKTVKKASDTFDKLSKKDVEKAVKKTVSKAVSEGERFVSKMSNSTTKVISTAVSKKHAETGKKYISNKANKNVNALFIIPTSWITDTIDFVKDKFSKKKKKEENDKDPNSITYEITYKKTDEEKQDTKTDVNNEVKKADKTADNTKNPSWAKGLKRKEDELTHDEDQELVNPNYDPYDSEYSLNCAYCTAAYDLRKRGYDVEANPYKSGTNNDMYEISSWYKDTTVRDWEYAKNTKQADKVLNKMPDNSYGQFCMFWSMGGGHSVVWSRENGETVIRDCQSNTKYTYDEWVKNYGSYVTDITILRTDNRKPSDKIKNTVRNRKGD